jgi:hypothetical protein
MVRFKGFITVVITVIIIFKSIKIIKIITTVMAIIKFMVISIKMASFKIISFSFFLQAVFFPINRKKKTKNKQWFFHLRYINLICHKK